MAISDETVPETFVPLFDECDAHGRFQRSFWVEGSARFVPVCPKCIVDEQTEKSIGRTAIPDRFKAKRFEDYRCADIEAQRAALALCRAYAQKFPEQRSLGRSIILCGKPGTGKTHLAAAILNFVTSQKFDDEQGFTGLYVTVSAAVRRVKESWSRDAVETEREAIAAMVKPDLLVLDEVGIQFGSDAEKMVIFEIVNGRYELTKPTIVIGNLNIEGMESMLGARVIDRLRENSGRAIVFDWPSHRKAA